MRKFLVSIILCAGCASTEADAPPQLVTPERDVVAAPPTTQRADPVIASISAGETTVTLGRDQYLTFLEETRGLDAVLNLMQLEMAKEQARQLDIDLATVDVEAEIRRTLNTGFRGPDGAVLEIGDYEAALQRVLTEQGLSRAEFDVVMETNAMLRAAAGPQIDQRLTDDVLREEFKRRYGEQAVIRVISFETIREATDTKNRAEAGEDFAELATSLNDDPGLAGRGGLIEPFTRQSNFPEIIKTASFALKPGDVSDPVESEGRYLLIKLEELREPRAVKFEDVRDELKAELVASLTEQVVEQYRRVLAGVLTGDALEIHVPMLADQLEARLEATRPVPVEPEELKQRLEAERPTTRDSMR